MSLVLLVSQSDPGLTFELSFGRGCSEISIGKVYPAIPSYILSWGNVTVPSVIQSLSTQRFADVFSSVGPGDSPVPPSPKAWPSSNIWWTETGEGHIIKTLPSFRVTNRPGSPGTVLVLI